MAEAEAGMGLGCHGMLCAWVVLVSQLELEQVEARSGLVCTMPGQPWWEGWSQGRHNWGATFVEQLKLVWANGPGPTEGAD